MLINTRDDREEDKQPRESLGRNHNLGDEGKRVLTLYLIVIYLQALATRPNHLTHSLQTSLVILLSENLSRLRKH